MKIHINKQTLYSVLRTANSVVPSNAINPIIESILIDVNKAANTVNFIFLNNNLKILYSVKENIEIETEGKVLIKLKMLEPIVAKLPNEMITLERIDTSSLKISKKNFESNINIIDETLFINIDFKIDQSWPSMKINSNTLKEIEKKLFHCCLSKIDSSSPLNGINFDAHTFDNEINFCATNSHKAGILTQTYEGEKLKFIMDTDALKFMNTNINTKQDVVIQYFNGKIYSQFENITMIVKVIDTPFVNLYKPFELTGDAIKFTVNSQVICDVVERGIFIVANDHNPTVKMDVSGNEIEISYKSYEIGSSFEKIYINEQINQNFKINFNSKYLLSTLKAFENSEIEIFYTSPNKQIIFKSLSDIGFKQLILPLRT